MNRIMTLLRLSNFKSQSVTFALGLLFILGFGHQSLAQQYKTMLAASNEPHRPMSTAKGEVWARLSGNTLKVWGSFSGLAGDFDAAIAGGSHIHTGYAGESGGIAFTLTPDLNIDLRGGSYDSTKNEFTLSTTQIAGLKERMLYVNIHTKFSAAGEIRGQFVPLNAKVFNGLGFGSNQTAMVMTGAMGSYLLDLVGTKLTVTGSFTGLEGDFDASIAGGIHIHKGMAGENGGIEVGLKATTNTDLRGGVLKASENTYSLTTSQVSSLMDNGLYINVHTKKFPSGEIRAQITSQSQWSFRTFLSGTNQNPTIVSSAMGMLQIDYKNDSITVSGSFSGLSSPADTALFGGAHIHIGYAGQNGGVDHVLNVTYSTDLMSGMINPKNNKFALSAQQWQYLAGRMYYVNVHSKMHPGGELRGQILPMSNYYFNVPLTASQQPTNVISQGAGLAVVEVFGKNVTLTGSFAELSGDFDASVAGGSHLHKGLAGMNGGIAVILKATTDAGLKSGVYSATDNQWTVSNGLLDSMRMRWHYLNIHTKTFGGGEIRGQVLPEATAYMFSKLSGSSHTPSVMTTGWGNAVLELKGNWAGLSGSFMDLTSDFDANIAGGAHIHRGLPGMNGGIWAGLKTTLASDNRSGRFEIMENNWTISDNGMDSFMNRLAYINIHTKNHASGEIRGQIMGLAKTYFTTALSGQNEVGGLMTPAMGAMKFEWNGNQLTAVGSFGGLESKIATALAGGSHIHDGINGANGGISLVLNMEMAADEMSAAYWADSNRFTLDGTLWNKLLNNGLYVNVHSIKHLAGVLRGQIQMDVNAFPNMDATITKPADGSKITVSGLSTGKIDVEWMAATDIDMDDLTYMVEMASDANFETIVATRYVGNNLNASWTYKSVDSMLSLLGVLLNAKVNLYYRVLAGDGCNWTPSASQMMELTRGILTGNEEWTLSNSPSAIVFPNVNNGNFNLKLNLMESQPIQLSLFSITGQLIETRNSIMSKGISTTELNYSNVESGQYILRIQGNNFVQAQKLIITK